MSLARRTAVAISWNFVANLTKLVVLFVRSVLLARWLPVEVFGIYAFAAAIVNVSTVVVNFGMGPAFLHRAPETEDEEQAAAAHFTLKLVFTLVWMILLMLGAVLFTQGPTRMAVIVLTLTTAGLQLTETPRLILVRRVVHRRLALIGLVNVLLVTLVTLGLARKGASLWALLGADVVGIVISVSGLYLWQGVWRPRVAWSTPTIRYLLRFGSRSFLASILWVALDRIDDLWTGVYLGETSLGHYSRAFRFATYPRTLLAVPIESVTAGTYAELKDDRRRLSQAFFRITSLLIRSGFFLAGSWALAAPEFVRLLLGDKWLPMLDAFRLMLVFTLLDPLRKVMGHLFTAVGRPEQVIPSLLIRLSVLVVGLFVLGPWLGIRGVALAVDAMLVVGTAILLWQARAHVDFSLSRLFSAPTLALILGLLLARGAVTFPVLTGSDWRTGSVKLVVFSVVYGAVLVSIEGRQVIDLLSWLSHSFMKGSLNFER